MPRAGGTYKQHKQHVQRPWGGTEFRAWGHNRGLALLLLLPSHPAAKSTFVIPCVPRSQWRSRRSCSGTQ